MPKRHAPYAALSQFSVPFIRLPQYVFGAATQRGGRAQQSS